MFQDHALFPHRDVAANVAFGLRDAGCAAHRDRAARVTELLELVGLAGFERRAVRELSGGEQQRVALARALAPDPRLLMLDEPLGALDRVLRERLVTELGAIFDRRERTILLVTHDHEEAFALADRVVLIHEGRVEQDASAVTVWQSPANAFVAAFLGYNVDRGVRRPGRSPARRTPPGSRRPRRRHRRRPDVPARPLPGPGPHRCRRGARGRRPRRRDARNRRTVTSIDLGPRSGNQPARDPH